MSQITTQRGLTPVPQFKPEMKSTHKLLAPQMAPIHFRLIMDAFRQDGYDIEFLENSGPRIAQEGLQYVHNDACYPALLVIGQFIDALKSGKYDIDHVALIITQTGGGCRASNYIHLLRKALLRAGFPQVPVVSINFSNLEKGSGLPLTLGVLYKALASCLYGDALMALANQIRPYEVEKGAADALLLAWQDKICTLFREGKGTGKADMRRVFDSLAADFAAIPILRRETYKVGIVGEIYVKFSPLGNNSLEAFLAAEGCEICMPGLTGFVQYCAANYGLTTSLYGGSKIAREVADLLLKFIQGRELLMHEAIRKHGLRAPCSFDTTMKLAQQYIGMGVKMGEGWLLTGEMAELIESGFPNIVCAQPFGCLPNHIVGRGMISRLHEAYLQANIVSIDYDPSATRVNQENRIKLMLSSAEKTL